MSECTPGPFTIPFSSATPCVSAQILFLVSPPVIYCSYIYDAAPNSPLFHLKSLQNLGEFLE
jgi:hypothetical protein